MTSDPSTDVAAEPFPGSNASSRRREYEWSAAFGTPRCETASPFYCIRVAIDEVERKLREIV